MSILLYRMQQTETKNKCGFYLKDFVALFMSGTFKDLGDNFSVCFIEILVAKNQFNTKKKGKCLRTVCCKLFSVGL